MFMRNLLLCTMVATGSLTLPAAAQVNINIEIGVAPPPPRYEIVPAPRMGYNWAPGYWQWEGQRHVWASGRWMEARRRRARDAGGDGAWGAERPRRSP